MHDHQGIIATLSHFVHRYLIWLLIGCYALAGFFPAWGLAIRSVTFGHVSVWGETTRISPPMVMLAILLLNAALAVDRLWGLLRGFRLLLAGLTANLALPVVFLFGVSAVMQLWHNHDDLQAILVALALVSAVPVAGASTAYTQNADGDLALAVSLVLASTFLSPLIMPVSLDLVDFAAVGDYGPALAELKGGGPTMVLILSVVLPSLFGLAIRPLIGVSRIKSAKPALKLVNSVNLLLLNYTNASVALPQIVADPDWSFLSVALTFMTGLCVVDFLAGWWIARLLWADAGQRLALMFGVGMNNNGTALVLASLALADKPKILVPIIFYGLVQHLVAGCSVIVVSRTSASRALNAPA